MLTYTLDKQAGLSLYEQLYRRVKADILSGRLAAGEKLPSKRALAAHLEVSVITVKNAYEQLMAEGYLTGVEKKGYFVSAVLPSPAAVPASPEQPPPPREPVWFLDLATNSIAAEDFPFTVWARLMRQTILEQGTGLLRSTPPQGAWALRQAIAAHLRQFRAMEVTAEQIIVGAGTEVLYNLLVQLLGRDRLYGVEDPGYGKIAHIYRAAGAEVTALPLDEAGVSVEALRRSDADVVHISPSHHYPTGLVMPIARRQELLGLLLQGLAHYRPAVRQEALLVTDKLLFEEIPSIFGEPCDSDALIYALKNEKDECDEYLRDCIEGLAHALMALFGPDAHEDASLSSVLRDWVDAHPAVQTSVYSGINNQVLQAVATSTGDDFVTINRIAKAATALRIDDWNDERFDDFLRIVQGMKTEVESTVDEAGTTEDESACLSIRFADEGGVLRSLSRPGAPSFLRPDFLRVWMRWAALFPPRKRDRSFSMF